MPTAPNRIPSELFAEIKWLREKTGYNAMSCREALIEANEDRQVAKAILRRKTHESMRHFGGVLE